MRLPSRPNILRGLGLLPILAVTLVLAPLLPVPIDSVRWHGIQTLAVEVGAVGLLAALLCRPWPTSWRQTPPSLRQGSLLCLHGLLVWALVSCLRDPNPFAVQGLLMLGFGVLAADVAAAQVIDQRRMLFLISALLFAAVLVCGSGLLALGRTETALTSGSLRDHQLFGAFMAIPLLLSLALSLGAGAPAQRLASQVVLLVCLTGLWEAQDRSAWLGFAASLLAFAALSAFISGFFAAGLKTPLRLGAFVPLLLVLAAVLGVILLSPDRDKALARLESVAQAPATRFDSRVWRKQVWTGTRRMIAEKPLWGWGIGSFPVTHQPFTGTGQRAGEVYASGPNIDDEAHNSYLQIWAEIGGVGLLLWLGALGSFLVAGVRALPRYPARSPAQWVLIGCLSAIAGQMVDAFANPAWQFGPVLLPLWVVLGLTAALTRPVETGHKHRHSASLILARLGQAALAAGVSGGLVWLIFSTAFALPAPKL